MKFWSVVSSVAEVKATQPRKRQDIKPQKVRHPGEKGEITDYVALCKKTKAETPVVRMLQLRYFLAERGIPEYDAEKVHQHLKRLACARDKGIRRLINRLKGVRYEYYWLPLRTEDMGTTFSWRWGYKDRYGGFRSKLYPQLVPKSVMETVATILKEFSDARFFVSSIEEVKDPFLLVTFRGGQPVIVEFWNEPGFYP